LVLPISGINCWAIFVASLANGKLAGVFGGVAGVGIATPLIHEHWWG